MEVNQDKKIKFTLFSLIAITAIIRLLVASTLELSVDEVYYWTYALYPDWSHFDHPPMVGLIIQLFSLNLLLDNELAIRLGPIVISALSTLVVFSIGKSIKNPWTGLLAALLFNASIYCSVLAGNFIIPDTPQLLFWLLSIKYLLKSLPSRKITRQNSVHFIAASFFTGLAILSKYHAIFILGGTGLYVLLYNRLWLKKPAFYLGVFISVLAVLPIVYWNMQNNWISFTFHESRVANQLTVRPDYLLTELFGQFAYNNPINYVLIIISLKALFKKKFQFKTEYTKILLLNGLPIWLVFTSFSLFRQTLPHWTGPAFTPLIFIAAAFISEYYAIKKQFIPKPVKASLILLYSALPIAWMMINFYPGTLGKTKNISKYGDTDFTLDMFGWDQIASGFKAIEHRDVQAGSMPAAAPIISPKYFPGTEIDYYVARSIHKKVLLYGTLPNIHKYAWISRERGLLKKGEDAYMISTSNWYKDPFEYYADNFSQIIPTDTIRINRSGKLAYLAFIYQLKSYKGNFEDPFKNN